MAGKKKTKQSLGKKAMKKTKGGQSQAELWLGARKSKELKGWNLK